MAASQGCECCQQERKARMVQSVNQRRRPLYSWLSNVLWRFQSTHHRQQFEQAAFLWRLQTPRLQKLKVVSLKLLKCLCSDRPDPVRVCLKHQPPELKGFKPVAPVAAWIRRSRKNGISSKTKRWQFLRPLIWPLDRCLLLEWSACLALDWLPRRVSLLVTLLTGELTCVLTSLFFLLPAKFVLQQKCTPFTPCAFVICIFSSSACYAAVFLFHVTWPVSPRPNTI